MMHVSENSTGYEGVCECEHVSNKMKTEHLNLWLYVSECVTQHVCLVFGGLEKYH